MEEGITRPFILSFPGKYIEIEKVPREFHVPKFSAIEKISFRKYVEHMDNKGYLGGEMFVKAKL